MAPFPAHQPENEEGPGVSDLAEKIKALKASHSIEATAQRVRQKQSTAEEPVSARIRRRREAIPGSAQLALSEATEQPPSSAPDSSSVPQSAFQARIAIERQRKDDGPGPP
jgi:primosomal protein N''